MPQAARNSFAVGLNVHTAAMRERPDAPLSGWTRWVRDQPSAPRGSRTLLAPVSARCGVDGSSGGSGTHPPPLRLVCEGLIEYHTAMA